MSGNKVSSFKERFAGLVSSSGKSQSSIADDIGVAKQTISAWITGQSSPRAPVLTFLADYFDVNPAWLIGYDVPKTVDKEKLSRYVNAVITRITLSDDENLLLDGYRSLTRAGQEYMLNQLTAAKAIYGEKDIPAAAESM